MPTHTATIDHSKPITVSVVFASPQVFSYRLWLRQLSTDPWNVVFDGGSDDNLPDVKALGTILAGGAIAYWIGIAGDASSEYDVKLVFTQDNAVVSGGLIDLDADTNAKGAAVEKGLVAFP